MPAVAKNKNKQSFKKVSAAKKDADTTTPVISGQLKKKMKKNKKRSAQNRGIVLIKCLPDGFFEEQLRNYFQQFGKVTNLRLVRSKRTGGSKGFAFIEFEYPEVAQIAAETMDNYLMFNRLVKASYIPPEEQNHNYFKTSVRKITNKIGKDVFVSSKTAAIKRQNEKYNDWSDEAYQKRTKKTLQKLEKLHEKFGIDISKIVVKPKTIIGKNSAEEISEEENKENSFDDNSILKKRKATNVQKQDTSNENISKKPKIDEKSCVVKRNRNTEATLASLADTIIDEDSSEDEDFDPADVDENEEDHDIPSSDENIDEAHDITSDDDEEELEDSESDSEEDDCDQTQDPKLEDLLGDTINEESSDDEDFVVSEGDENCIEDKKSGKSLKFNKNSDSTDSEDSLEEGNEQEYETKLEDLLGDTINEEGSSEDEDFIASEIDEDDNVKLDESKKSNESDDSSVNVDSSEENDEQEADTKLEDLLGDTINEEDSSEDEDYVASDTEEDDDKNEKKLDNTIESNKSNDTYDNADSSEEDDELMLNNKGKKSIDDTMNEEEESSDDEDSNDDESSSDDDKTPVLKNKKSALTKKPALSGIIESRLKNVFNRQIQSGRIQKKNKNDSKKVPASAAKTALKVSAIEEMTKAANGKMPFGKKQNMKNKKKNKK